MKKIRIQIFNAICLSLFIVTSVLAEDITTVFQDKHIPVLVWKDAESKRVLFTSDDIISFDWDKQLFLLKLDATRNFVSCSRYFTRHYTVSDENSPLEA